MRAATTAPMFLTRHIPAGEALGFAWLDAVTEPAGAGRRDVRVFGRAGPVSPIAHPTSGGLSVSELRPVSGAIMVVAQDQGAGGTPVTLSLPDGQITLPATASELDLLAGRNVLLGFRTVESAANVLEWLTYHARHHKATGALIINRLPQDDLGSALADHASAFAGLDLTCVVLDSPVPLGKPGHGPESHPFYAPDAPGKDRMTPPDVDPWRAPLGEPLLYEYAKWRFLAQARAVLTLDPCDLLPAPGDTNAFDLCRSAKSGAVLLAGRRIYPWRVRPGRAAGFGDHICRQFDGRRGIARWGVAPAKAGLEKTWRALRVSFARPDPGQIVPFWRAMALRVPGQKPSVLAPKTSLVEDPALLDLAEKFFSARPVRPPRSSARAAPRLASEAGRTCIVTTMKDEGPFILEWLAFHRAIGVDDFLIYSNDCSDGTDRFLDLLQAKGLVKHRPNPFRSMPGLRPQHAALQAAEAEEVIRQSGWIICMDVDEFINIKIGDGRLDDLYRAMGEGNMISLTWRLFGNADIASYSDRPITEQFRLAAPELVRKPHQAWGFKTLFRNIDIYKKLGVHRPKGLKPDLWQDICWLNGSGARMPIDLLRNGWRSSSDSYGYDWVQLNHYACRSVESFLVKRERGRVNHVDRDQGLNYWFRMNHNALEDVSVQRLLPLMHSELAALKADPEIAAAHEACVDAHRTRIARLRQKPDFMALYDALTSERMRALSRLLRHFGASVFNSGPDVIPPDLHRLDLPEDYFFSIDVEGDGDGP